MHTARLQQKAPTQPCWLLAGVPGSLSLGDFFDHLMAPGPGPRPAVPQGLGLAVGLWLLPAGRPADESCDDDMLQDCYSRPLQLQLQPSAR